MKFTVSKKLLFSFFSVLIIMGIIVGIANNSLSNINNSYQNLINDRVNKL